MEEKETNYHVPVMLDESVKGLNIQEGGIYVDVTFGGGGHSREILKRMDSDGELYGFDQDADAEHNIPDDSRFVFVRSNFRYLYNFMRYHGVDGEVDGLLADLGVSSHHFDDKDRGFSFRFDGALDMRMNARAGQTAADIVNNYTEEALADVFYLYGELKVARRLASLIVRTRENKKIETIGDFLELVKPFTGKDKEKKFLAQAFQALRIDVNQEFEVLYEFMEKLPGALKPGGRAAILTFHSGEDKLVKAALKEGCRAGIYSSYSKDVVRPTAEECVRNPRARSTKMRWAIRAEE